MSYGNSKSKHPLNSRCNIKSKPNINNFFLKPKNQCNYNPRKMPEQFTVRKEYVFSLSISLPKEYVRNSFLK